MQTYTHNVVVSIYSDSDVRPFWLPVGHVRVGTKHTEQPIDLDHDEYATIFESATYADAAKHFGFTYRTYTKEEIAKLLLSSDKAVKVACARLADVYYTNRIFEAAKYEGLKPSQMAEARAEALQHTAHLADLATYKAVQPQVDAALWSREAAKVA